jgi:AcrR family transcriptional regulator
MTVAVRRPGRPRNETSREKILEAALSLVSEGGLASATMEGIAAAAGVGKQTLYRWWRSRAEILLEALGEHAASVIPEPNTGSLQRDLEEFLEATFRAGRRKRVGAPLLTALMAEAQVDTTFRARFRDGFIEARRAVLRRIFERAAERGETRRSFDADLGVDMLFGVMWYRMLVGHLPINDDLVVQLAQAATRAAT